ncbi:MAG: hypothetical protein LBR76_03440 [Oscillospiraceae bacterium]|jgi:outer membrane biosynthesis protein TonB|nr:hypothetical protein [Oscillospiraceae bacterium]
MKNIMKLAAAFVFGVSLTLAVTFLFILPSLQIAPADSTPAADQQADALAAAGVDETGDVVPEPSETESVMSMVPETPEPSPSPTPVPTPGITPEPSLSLDPSPTPEPSPDPKPTPPATVQPSPKPAATPAQEIFYDEDGRRYTYLNGFKMYLADEDDPNVIQKDYYDWENDPDKDIPGPFN